MHVAFVVPAATGARDHDKPDTVGGSFQQPKTDGTPRGEKTQ
jgi:hypothetical protein